MGYWADIKCRTNYLRREVCSQLMDFMKPLKQHRNAINDQTILDALAFMRYWGTAMTFHPKASFDDPSNKEQNQWGYTPAAQVRGFANHLMTQMQFFNIYLPKHLYDFDPLHKDNLHLKRIVNEVDVTVRIEHMKEALLVMQEKYPTYATFDPDKLGLQMNSYKNSGSDDLRFSCDVAWEMYDYYIQDFICLGYELPQECLKQECRKN